MQRQNLPGQQIGRARALLQTALHALYPPQCATCDAPVDADGALCPSCWRATPFISGACCDTCGLPLPGDPAPGLQCDECLTVARPWEQGRAALLYDEQSRKLLLGLKYHDRMDIAPMAAHWMVQAASPLLRPDLLVAPVPLAWVRLVRRRYNQAALLSRALARRTGLDHCPDLLTRMRHTGTQDGRTRAGRFTNVEGAFRVPPRRQAMIAGRHILLVDDVMTAGATLAACTEACLGAGAVSVRVVVLARVARAA
jgi:ComF family protein